MFIKGVVTLFLYALNLFINIILILMFIFKKQLPHFWISTNRLIRKHVSGVNIEAHLPEDLNLETFYLVTSNHQTWADILVLFDTFDQKIPMLKFFTKKQLLWVPMVGFACWAYDFPFLYRHTKAQLKKHPEWKNRDFEATKKACEKFKKTPGSLMLFAEGTRFTPAKHQKQASPFQHLLKPKAGGMAFALRCMEGRIKSLVDVTIVYPDKPSFWDYCCGKMKKISVYAKVIPLPESILFGDYENDPEYRVHFQQFLNTLWTEKDKSLSEIYAKKSL